VVGVEIELSVGLVFVGLGLEALRCFEKVIGRCMFEMKVALSSRSGDDPRAASTDQGADTTAAGFARLQTECGGNAVGGHSLGRARE